MFKETSSVPISTQREGKGTRERISKKGREVRFVAVTHHSLCNRNSARIERKDGRHAAVPRATRLIRHAARHFYLNSSIY